MFCTKCGAKLPDGAKFCTKCGAPAGAAPTPGPAATKPPEPRPEPVREAAPAPRPVQAPPPEPPRRTPREPELPEEDGSRGGGKTVGIVAAILAVAAVLCVCIVLFLPKLLSGDKGAPKATPDPVETSTPKPASTPAPESSTEPRPTEPTTPAATPASPAPTAQVVELVTEEKALDLVAAAYNCAPKLESSSGGVYTIACYRTGTVDLATKETAYTGYLGGVTVDAATGTITPLPGDDPAKAGEYLFPTDKSYITPDEKLQDYFNSQSWYTPGPGVDAGSLGTQDFNEYERANVDTIIQYEKDKGWK